MKIIVFAILIFFLFPENQAVAQQFLRELPSLQSTTAITSARFKYDDAIIILKEQSYKTDLAVIDHDRYGNSIAGLSAVRTTIKIIKVLTEKGVQDLGTFSDRFSDYMEIGPENVYQIRVRVLKPDSTIYVLNETDIRRFKEGFTKSNDVTWKITYRIPDLKVNDIIQIEVVETDPFAKLIGGFFVFSDTYPVLYSNLYVTMRNRDLPRFYSFPPEKIGHPAISQVSENIGSGKTYFWSVRNLNGIHSESFDPPRLDQEIMTIFKLTKIDRTDNLTWNHAGNNFFEDYIDYDDVSQSQIQSLGFRRRPEGMDIRLIDSLYAAIRNKFSLLPDPGIYPLKIDYLFERMTGDASDLAFLFHKVLKEWEVKSECFLMRNQNQGTIEESAPTLSWFNRMGVKVTIDSTVRYYDFDAAAPSVYQLPTYLVKNPVLILREEYSDLEKIAPPQPKVLSSISENRFISVEPGTVRDSTTLSLTGYFAEEFRHEHFRRTSEEISKVLSESPMLSHYSQDNLVVNSQPLGRPVISWNATGNWKEKPEIFGDQHIIRLKSLELSSLRDKLFSPIRYGHLYFNVPFTLSTTTQVEIPDGFHVSTQPASVVIPGPDKITFHQYVSSPSPNRIVIENTLNIPSEFLDISQYKALQEFLEKAVTTSTSEIIFTKTDKK